MAGQENTIPSRELLSLNLGIAELAEIVDFKGFCGTIFG